MTHEDNGFTLTCPSCGSTGFEAIAEWLDPESNELMFSDYECEYCGEVFTDQTPVTKEEDYDR